MKVGSKNGRRSKRASFALLEVIISLTILSVTVAAILRSFSLSFSAIRRLEVSTQAAFFAQQILDEYEIDPPTDDRRITGGFGEDYIDYYFTAELTYVEPDYDDVNFNENINSFFPLRALRVEVYYDNGRNAPIRAISLDSAIMGFERFSIEHKRQFFLY
jgi:general secretion pathway protein I